MEGKLRPALLPGKGCVSLGTLHISRNLLSHHEEVHTARAPGLLHSRVRLLFLGIWGRAVVPRTLRKDRGEVTEVQETSVPRRKSSVPRELRTPEKDVKPQWGRKP